MTETEISRPWYRYTIPWLIIGVLTLTVLSGISMIIISSGGKDSVVVDDYYKQGLTINTSKEQLKMARALGIRLQVLPGNSRVLTLQGNFKDREPQLIMHLKHPTLKKNDVRITFSRHNSSYQAQLPDGLHGKYYYTIMSANGHWGLKGEIEFGTGSQARITAY